MEDIHKERGPVPPLYTLDDLKDSEALYVSISAWLEEKLPAQEKLGVTDDPVLLVKELTDRREKLDKAGMDLAMKGVRNFEKRKASDDKEKKKAKKAEKEKEKANKTKSAAKPAQTIKLGEDGEMPTQEEMDEMIKGFMAEEERRAEEHKKKEEEAAAEAGEKEEGRDEL